jgi:hypothetical protein
MKNYMEHATFFFSILPLTSSFIAESILFYHLGDINLLKQNTEEENYIGFFHSFGLEYCMERLLT